MAMKDFIWIESESAAARPYGAPSEWLPVSDATLVPRLREISRGIAVSLSGAQTRASLTSEQLGVALRRFSDLL
jgi:hypothetical protein